jgi:hypothetical protein
VGRYQVVRTVSRTLAGVLVAAWAGPVPLAAQVGLGSNVARVTLVVQVPPKVSIRGATPLVRSSNGAVTEASVKLRLSTNTGYRLVAVGLGSGRGPRLWVRSASGEFQELTAGASVTVARDSRVAGEFEREVSYRIESAGGDRVESLPVRYEVVINPTI